jgi:hypothetical protein
VSGNATVALPSQLLYTDLDRRKAGPFPDRLYSAKKSLAWRVLRTWLVKAACLRSFSPRRFLASVPARTVGTNTRSCKAMVAPLLRTASAPRLAARSTSLSAKRRLRGSPQNRALLQLGTRGMNSMPYTVSFSPHLCQSWPLGRLPGVGPRKQCSRTPLGSG